jgi:RNA polymerase sigma-70 factor (ECF subfamily)
LLVLRCQTGDEGAFADLYHRYGDPTRRYLRGFLDPDAADDVLQEIWLTVYQRIGEVTNPAGFRAWLFRTARHRAIDVLRAERRRSRQAGEAFAEVGRWYGTRADLSPADTSALDAALATLSPEHREAVQLRFLEDLAYADIASITGCPLGTVRSRIHHGTTGQIPSRETSPPSSRGRRNVTVWYDGSVLLHGSSRSL